MPTMIAGSQSPLANRPIAIAGTAGTKEGPLQALTPRMGDPTTQGNGAHCRRDYVR